MIEDTTITPMQRRTPVASKPSTPERPDASPPFATPKLGDFGRIHASGLSYTPDDKPVSLGNFSKIFSTLKPSPIPTPTKKLFFSETLSDSTPRRPASQASSSAAQDIPASLASIRDELRRKLFESFTPSVTDSDTDVGEADFSSAELTTPPSSVEREPPPIAILKKSTVTKLTPTQVLEFAEATATVSPSLKSQLQHVISYQTIKYGAQTPIYETPRTTAAQHERLSQGLIPIRAQDAVLAARCPEITHQGIHVFLDMSNINISFQTALRNRYRLPDTARFVPLPQLNLSFLTEILVRGRETEILNAGCSVVPGRPAPHFIADLEALSYRVDLRERKRVTEPNTPGRKGNVSSSDEAPYHHRHNPRGPVRYVEDLVDETLQTRIAESVMEHFSSPGTLVIATGDAKPAKFSDGFFTYADRALKMGWHVEVVSWRSSLSHSWRNPEWTGLWGERFRVIELDGFLDELLYTP